MTDVIKKPLIITCAGAITLLLFLCVHLMVTKTPQSITGLANLNLINFIRMEQPPAPPESRTEKIKPEEPPPPEKVPPVPKLETKAPPPAPIKMDLPTPDIRLPSSIQGVPYTGDYLKSPPAQPVTGSGDALSMPEIITDIVPTVRIEPQYPSRALHAGIEGTVTVEFTIAADGSVKDIQIVSADPPKIFDNEVLKALKRWKFPPQTIDGKTVEKRARQDIRFTLRK
jgi:protein TonB